MKTIQLPPEEILRAYADLINQAFLFVRAHAQDVDAEMRELLFDLGDAMHNIGSIFADYGTWTNDDKYRQLYLRPFDQKWGARGLHLESHLNARLSEYSKT